MKTIGKKILFCISCLCVIFCMTSCGGNKNDRVYTMEEIEGTYEYSTYSNGTTYDYILTIDDGYAKAIKESYTFEGDRLGMPHNVSNLFSGNVELTDTSIKIGSYTGYIKTEYRIKITINDITYEKN